MALFSDLDWIIVLGVGAFLLFGRGSGAAVRQLGRWYARAVRLKQELVSEVARAADLPAPAGGAAGSLRAALLGLEVGAPPSQGRPPALPSLPLPSIRSPALASLPTTGGSPVTSWGATYFDSVHGPREIR